MQNREQLAILALFLMPILGGCATGSDVRRVTPAYDEFTRRLVALYADQDADGRVEQWSYFDGNRPLRGEKDTDADGRVDRWEYFGPDAALVRVGTSSAGDGVEDTWTWTAPDDGAGRIDRSRRRDRHIDRREYFRDGVMTRAEEDTNADGRIDQWNRYEAGVLRQVDFDTTLTSGRPDRRAFYSASGQFERVEADPEHDGMFVPLPGAAPPSINRGVPR